MPTKRCYYCGGVRPRTIVAFGYAHKYCIPGNPGSGVVISADAVFDKTFPKEEKSVTTKKPKPIRERIREAYKPGIEYHELGRTVFPREHFPRSQRHARQGGPPGYCMTLTKVLKSMNADFTYKDHRRFVWLPKELPFDKDKDKAASGRRKRPRTSGSRRRS